jgi:GNAT superfamily N-acetyltransferase
VNADALRGAPMTARTRAQAVRLLGAFLAGDDHYRASAGSYGDGGPQALERALDLFLARPELGFVWLACRGGTPLGACVVCYAISTSRGTLVAKLDDVTVDASQQGQGIGAAMLASLIAHLRAGGVTRIDTACHRANTGAWHFYERLGFRPLDEERLALLI